MYEITLLFKKLSSISRPDEIRDDEFELHYLSSLCKIIFKNLQHDREHPTYQRSTKATCPLRSVLQSSKWRQSFCKDFDGRDACQWVWQNVENEMIPLWTDLPQTSNLWRELVKCGCKEWYQGGLNKFLYRTSLMIYRTI